jgi:hypothetical protein
MVPRKVQNAACKNRGGGKQDSGAKQVANVGFEALVVQRSIPFL